MTSNRTSQRASARRSTAVSAAARSVRAVFFLLAAIVLFATAAPALAASVTVADIIANSQSVLAKIKTISLTIAMTQVASDKTETKMRASVLGDRGLELYRITMLEPAALADQVVVVDTKAKKVRMYMPVSNQIIVRSLDDSTAQGGQVGFDFSRLSQLPSTKDYDIKLTAVQKSSAGEVYVLTVTPKKQGVQAGVTNGSQKVWVRSNDWMIAKVELYDEKGQLVGTMALQEIKLNPKLTKTQLTQLPKDAQVIEQ